MGKGGLLAFLMQSVSVVAVYRPQSESRRAIFLNVRGSSILFIAIGATAGHLATDVSAAARLVVFQRLPLSETANGIDGELQLMQDARLTASLRKDLWGMGDLSDAADAQGPVLSGGPLRNAVVRIVRSDGTPVKSEALERPLARLEHARLYREHRDTFLLTVDYSTGVGSYSGPVTLFVEVTGGRLEWLEATESSTGKKERIALMRSLKTIWKIVAAPDGSGKEILEALCRPVLETALKPGDVEFRLTYRRYSFDGKKWVSLASERKGFSEFEDGIPNRSLFP